MFIIFDNKTNKLVTRMSPEWQSGFDILHERANAGQFVCPWCRHELWFREKSERCRSHFAHRSVLNCPYACMSDEKMESVALLYEWLSQQNVAEIKFLDDLKIEGWNYPADVVIKLANGRKIAYWIFDRTPKHREALRSGLPKQIKRQILYTSSMRKFIAGNERLILSAGQCELIDNQSDYDFPNVIGHLHFIDSSSRKICICRNVNNTHAREYTCNTREASLSDCCVDQRTGEIVAPGDRKVALALDD